MKAIILNEKELGINYINSLSAGHGHKAIIVELHYKENYKTFSATTTNMHSYDEATELEGEEKDEALFNLIAYKIEELVSEWITEIEKI